MRNPKSKPNQPCRVTTLRLNDPVTDVSVALLADILEDLLNQMVQCHCDGFQGFGSGFYYRCERVGSEVSLLIFERAKHLRAYRRAIESQPFAGQDLQYLVVTHVPRSAVSPQLRSRLAALGVGRGIAISKYGPHGREDTVRELDARLLAKSGQSATEDLRGLAKEVA